MAVIENTTALFQGIIERDSAATLVSRISRQDKTDIWSLLSSEREQITEIRFKKCPQGIPNSMFRKQELCLYWGTGDL